MAGPGSPQARQPADVDSSFLGGHGQTATVGRVFRTMRHLGWRALEGWWLWQLPDELEPLDMVRQPVPKMMLGLRVERTLLLERRRR